MPLRRRLVEGIPEPTLRFLVRLRNGETSAQGHARASGRALVHPGSGTTPLGYLDPTVIGGEVRPKIVTGFDAHEVRRTTAAAVTDALSRHAVPFVTLPGARGTVARIAVSDEHREGALRALETELDGPEWGVRLEGRRSRARRAGGLTRYLAARRRRLRLYRLLAAPTGELLGTAELGCDLEFWARAVDDGLHRDDGDVHVKDTRLAPSPNGVVSYVTPQTWARSAASAQHQVPPDPLPFALEVREPVDIVYTWVDGDDPAWAARKAAFSDHPTLALLNPSAAHDSRFASRDELKYSLRSVAMYASWVRRIFIVTDGQVPEWLATEHPQISVIDHREIFRDPAVLPVFNSHAIESQLHHISGLSEQYLYLNDDVFFGRPVEPELFFHGNGIAKFFLSPVTLDIDPPSSRDLPVMSAAKRNRTLIEDQFGVTVTRKFKHTPHPQLRSLVDEMERRHPDVFAHVAASRFRHPDDLSIPSALVHYYAYCVGRAVPGEIEYRYQDIKRANTQRRLDSLVRSRSTDVFCLNDDVSDPEEYERQRTMLGDFFETYYPLPSPYERAEPKTT